ncbi:MAG: DUF4382 domain-containing protein, partial [Pseudomonadales bacterium]|nr:DUF4382 domain-containing protein [Pseudomonadales bacterium]
MKSVKTIALIAAALLFALTACSDGGSADQETDPAFGTMTLLVTDAESDRFNEILVSIEQVVLIADGDDEDGDDGEGHQEVLLDEPVTLNLRELTDFSEFLAEAEVEAGTYSKLRLVVDSIELNEVDENGNIVDSQTINVPSGKIDLNPRQPFIVNEGDEQVVMIDFDADNSFKVTATGSGDFNFRPVVFIKIIGDGDDSVPGRLIRQHGQVTSLNNEESEFELCALDSISAGDTDFLDPDECVDVEFDESTSFYIDGVTPASDADMVENDNVTVIGRVDNGEDGLEVTAITIVIGPADSITQVKGVMATTVTDGMFDLTTDDNQGFAETLSIELQENAIVFERHGGEMVDPGTLEIGTRITAFGASDSEVADEFNAIAVSVADDDDGEEVEGTISSVDGSTITVTAEDTTESCVEVQTDTLIQIHTETAEGEIVEEGTSADLVTGAEM